MWPKKLKMRTWGKKVVSGTGLPYFFRAVDNAISLNTLLKFLDRRNFSMCLLYPGTNQFMLACFSYRSDYISRARKSIFLAHNVMTFFFLYFRNGWRPSKSFAVNQWTRTSASAMLNSSGVWKWSLLRRTNWVPIKFHILTVWSLWTKSKRAGQRHRKDTRRYGTRSLNSSKRRLVEFWKEISVLKMSHLSTHLAFVTLLEKRTRFH